MTEIRYTDSMYPLSAQAVKQGGYSGSMRYFGQFLPKIIRKPEIYDYREHGVDMGAVYEDNANGALGGYQAGVIHASLANSQAADVEWPEYAAIYAAVDFQVSPNQIGLVTDYMRGFRDTLHHPAGVYGDGYVVDTIVDRLGDSVPFRWQCGAWSGNYVSPHADLYQRIYPNGSIPGNPSYDENVLIRPCGAWLLSNPDPPKPEPTPEPPKPRKAKNMIYVVDLEDGRSLKSDLLTYEFLNRDSDAYKIALWYAVAANGDSAHVTEGSPTKPENLSAWGVEKV